LYSVAGLGLALATSESVPDRHASRRFLLRLESLISSPDNVSLTANVDRADSAASFFSTS
jgi:hypothetical protein